MKVKWVEHAKQQRDMVADYIRDRFGAKRKRQFKLEVHNTIDMLKQSPNIGKIDPLFVDRPMTYRSIIINGLNKLVYRIDGDIIYVVGFWDTRTDDNSQAEKVQ